MKPRLNILMLVQVLVSFGIVYLVPSAHSFLPGPVVVPDGRSMTMRGGRSTFKTCRRAASGFAMSSAKPCCGPADKLRDLLSGPEVLTMPCCYNGLTARLVEQAGFPLTFMTGFGVSGAHGLPDTQVSSAIPGNGRGGDFFVSLLFSVCPCRFLSRT